MGARKLAPDIEGYMLKEIFKGLESAYGQTKITNEIRSDGKAEVKSFTIKKPVTNQLWEEHIKGSEPALGIVCKHGGPSGKSDVSFVFCVSCKPWSPAFDMTCCS